MLLLTCINVYDDVSYFEHCGLIENTEFLLFSFYVKAQNIVHVDIFSPVFEVPD